MGGHGGLNILPHKSWNVYGFKQRQKVARDEAEAEARARAASDADAQRGRCARGARRLGRDERILRRRPPRSHLLHHRLTPPPSTPSSRPRRPRRRDDRLAALRARARGEPPPASTDPARARAKSVNFFEAEEKALLKTKAEFDQHAGARLGGEKPGEVPWYARRRRSPSPDGVGAAAEGPTLGESGLTSHGVDGRAAKRRKKEKKKKRRSKTGGARGGDDDDDEAPRRSSGRAEPSSSDKIAKLREERLAREANERRRQRERTGVR